MDKQINKDHKYMQAALAEAKKALELQEIPVGAVVVYQNEIIGSGFNEKETTHDPTAHAEIIALRQAAARLQSWRLYDCQLYVTLEPCTMCAGALVQARLARLVFATCDPKTGAAGSFI